MREAVRNQPRLVLIEAPVRVPLGDDNPLAINEVTAKRNEAPFDRSGHPLPPSPSPLQLSTQKIERSLELPVPSSD